MTVAVATAVERRCPVCGESLDGRRPQAVYCGESCRVQASRSRAADASETFWTGVGSIRRRERRKTRNARFPRDAATTMGSHKQVGPRAANADPVTHKESDLP
jgi:hypothetical protein